MMKKKLIKMSLGLSSILLLNSSMLMAESNNTIIDTLVVYNQGAIDASDGDIETRMNHLFTTTNKIYEDSGLNIELNLVKAEKFNLDESADSGQVLSDTRQDAEVNALRDEVGADEVVIYRAYADDGMCGLAYVNSGNEAYAYAHVTIECASYVTAHEVGHNMSLWHSALQDPDAGYARGHGVQDQFTTVMAYESAYNGAKIYKFSDPDLDCNGEPCGVEVGLENEADAVKAILAQAPIIANYREHIVIDDTNTTDDSNTTDNNTTDNNSSLLDAAKKAYEAQILVVEEAKAELDRLKNNITTQINLANSTYKATVKELRDTYRANRAEAYAKLKETYSTLRTTYLNARSDYRARNITRSEYRAIIQKIRADRKAARDEYKETIKAERAKFIESIKSAKEERKATITAAIDAYTTYKEEVYLVEIAKLEELKKIYEELLEANG